MTKISDFQNLFESAIVDIAARTPDPEKRCIILSGGVDTCAILAAARTVNVTFAAAFTVICGDDSPDKGFATAAAKEHDIPHHIVELTPDDLVSIYLPKCIQLLHTFDGMTLRNSLVVAAVFHKASEMGFTDAIVGDAADELMGGYSFMWAHKDPTEWKDKRDKMCREWTFATSALAKAYNLTSHSPYMDPKVVEWALENVEREDCIGTRPIRLFYGGEFLEHETGKLLLREAYETVSSWRRKDPIEVGSGVTVIGHNKYWKDRVADEEFETEAAKLKERGFIIQSKEYLVNFRAFESCYGPDGKGLPTTTRLEIGQGCAGCCFDIGESMFCRICGAYPAQRSAS